MLYHYSNNKNVKIWDFGTFADTKTNQDLPKNNSRNRTLPVSYFIFSKRDLILMFTQNFQEAAKFMAAYWASLTLDITSLIKRMPKLLQYPIHKKKFSLYWSITL